MRGLIAALVLLGGPLLAQRGGPPYSPPDALNTFRLAGDFHIELFASEPLIADPVAMEVDEHGRAYVVEMHGYPLDVSGSGRVMLLDDTDGNGLPEKSTVFADGLRLPTGVMRWKNGVIVTDSPDVWYLEDSDGDGRADVKRTMLTGFALSNPQHNTNTPLYGLDNWIYLANEGPARTIRYGALFGDEGRPVHFPERPGGPRLPPDADGRNVRFRPDSYQLETLSSRSQFGQTFDEWGHHFLNTNNRHIYQEVIAARYLSRNPALVVANVVEQVPDYRQPAEVFPITNDPKFELLTDVGVMTSASGLTLYLADLFPPAYRRAAFVAEGAHNIVHVASVRDHGVTFRASRMFEGREFLASTDPWFRPVNFYLGPDGALYVIDYYRKILEHPEWLDDATAQSSELYAGKDRGRIYRIVPRGAAAPTWMNRVGLGTTTTEELVRRLSDPNIWWRRHAQRLLVDRKPRDAIGPLTGVVMHGHSAVGRVHALWTLEGMGRLDTATIEHALHDDVPGVRENAIKIAEVRLKPDATDTVRLKPDATDTVRLKPDTTATAVASGFSRTLLTLKNDPDPKVRFQLLLTLGDLGPAAQSARDDLLFDNVEDEWMQVAALSAADVDPLKRFRVTLISGLLERDTPGRRALLHRIAAMAGSTGNVAAIREIVTHLVDPAWTFGGWWQPAVLEGLASGVSGEFRRTPELNAEREVLTKLVVAGESGATRRAALQLLEAIGLPSTEASAPVLQEAQRVIRDGSATPESRTDAVRLLALHGADAHEDLLTGILSRSEPAPLQIAAIRALGQLKGARHAARFIELWDRWTPAVRDEAVRMLVREPERIRLLLDAVTVGKVRTTEIERPLRIRLMMVSDDEQRRRARALFAESPAAAKTAVTRYLTAASLDGNRERGRELFARACSSCHTYRGAGGVAFGPDLGEVRNRLPASLMTDILDPNHSIADGYELWLVQLVDGSSIGGIIGAETPTSVTFRLPGGSEATIPRAQIASMRIAESSAMPEGLDSQVNLQQMADLIAFIKGG